MYLDET